MAYGGQGLPVVLEATVKDALNAPTEPDTIELTIYDPEGEIELGPIPTAGLTDTGLGTYTYSWLVPGDAELTQGETGPYTAHWEGTIAGLPVIGSEPIFVVPPGAIATTPESLLVDPEDYDSVRLLLGVTETDLTNEVIASPPFQQHIEFRLKQKVPDWSTLASTPQTFYMLRMATTYGTAALIAETYAKGGFLGLVAPPLNTYEEWERLSKTLWGYYNYWAGEAAAVTEPGEEEVGFVSVPLVILAGPHRVPAWSPWAPAPLGRWAFIEQEPEVLMEPAG